jgi:hypothetical protein
VQRKLFLFLNSYQLYVYMYHIPHTQCNNYSYVTTVYIFLYSCQPYEYSRHTHSATVTHT